MAHAQPPYPDQHCTMLPLPRLNTAREGHFLLHGSRAPPLSMHYTSLLHVAPPFVVVPLSCLWMCQTTKNIFFIKQCRSRCFLALFFNIHSSLHCIASSFSCHSCLLPVNPYYFSVAKFVLLVSMLLTEFFFCVCDLF